MRLKQRKLHVSPMSIDVGMISLIDVKRSDDDRPNTFTYMIPIDVDVELARQLNIAFIDVSVVGIQHASTSIWKGSKGTFIEPGAVVDDILTAQQTLKLIAFDEQNAISTTRSSINYRDAAIVNDRSAVNIDLGRQQRTYVQQSLTVKQGILYDAVMDDGVDITKLYHTLFEHMTVRDTINGTRRGTWNVNVNAPVVNALGSSFSLMRQDVGDRTVEIAHTKPGIVRHDVYIDVDASKITGMNDINVIIELKDVVDLVVDTLRMNIRHDLMFAEFEVPTIAPNASVIRSGPGRNMIDVIQRDINGSAVRIYKRVLSRSSDVGVEDQYTFVADIDVKHGMRSRFIDVTNNAATSIYRFMTVGRNGMISRTFTDVVVRGMRHANMSRRRRSNAAAFTVERSDVGAIVTVTNIPRNIVAIAFQRCDAGDVSHFGYLDDGVVHVSDGVNLKFTDMTVKTGRMYEYRLMLYTDDGIKVPSSTTVFYEHVDSIETGVTIDVTDPVIMNVRGSNADAEKHDVRFSIRSSIIKTQEQVLYERLKDLDVVQNFDDELNDIRDKFAKIVAHGVQRINLSSGQIDDFGIITSDVFSDIELGKQRSLTALIPGVRYRYVITTFVRSPETLFDEFTKEKTATSKFDASIAGASNLSTSKYKFKPSKSLHPAVKHGAISSITKRSQLYARDELSYGRLGNVHTIDVTIPSRSVRLTTAVVSKIGKDVVNIMWQITGDRNLIEHFVITCDNAGTQRFIAVAHAFNDTSTFQLKHMIDERFDRGLTSYTIMIVESSFKFGSMINTNEIIC